jgi:hypothetical protein
VHERRLVLRRALVQAADGRALGRLAATIAPVAGPEVVGIGHVRGLSGVGGMYMRVVMV